MKHLLDKKHLKLLYNAYVHSHLAYFAKFACMCTDAALNPLIKIQKKAIRSICNAGYRDHTAPLFSREEIFPLKQESLFQCITFMYSYKHNQLPSSFHETWIEIGNYNPYQLRNSADYYIPHVRYLYLFKHPLYYFPRVWNELEPNLKNIVTKREFVLAIKNKLFSQIN